MVSKSVVTKLTGNNEWMTPIRFIEMARQVMGSIDTDPASNEIAQKNIKAPTYYTQFDDGLSQQWLGNVWLNPPYSRGMMNKFSAKLLEELRSGNATNAIMLTSAATDTKWFHSLAKASKAYCLTSGRIKFIQPNGNEGKSPPHGHAFFYFGNNLSAFRTVFSSVGLVSEPKPISFL